MTAALASRLLRRLPPRRHPRRCTILSFPGPPDLHCSAAYTNSAGDGGSARLPPPIRVSLTDSAGRGVFATRRIGAGDLIHTAEPVVAHPSLALLQKVCYFCLRRLNNEATGGHDQFDGNVVDSSNPDVMMTANQMVRFCNEECRKRSEIFYGTETIVDWSLYNDHCSLQGLKYPLLVKRFACMVMSGVVSANYLHILQPDILYPKMITQMEAEFQLLRSSFMNAGLEKEKSSSFLTEQWYLDVLARVRINAFRIELVECCYEDLLSSAVASVEAEVAVGNAVYMLPSFYNHDCDPNAHIVWIENVNARVKALRDIEEGEELRICYIDASMDREARQSILLQGFGFQCHCARCISGD